jgi:hypothetical protein
MPCKAMNLTYMNRTYDMNAVHNRYLILIYYSTRRIRCMNSASFLIFCKFPWWWPNKGRNMSWVQKLLNKILCQLLRNRRYYYLQVSNCSWTVLAYFIASMSSVAWQLQIQLEYFTACCNGTLTSISMWQHIRAASSKLLSGMQPRGNLHACQIMVRDRLTWTHCITVLSPEQEVERIGTGGWHVTRKGEREYVVGVVVAVIIVIIITAAAATLWL